MPRLRRSDPMPVKYWSSAGLILTYWCNARCDCCYLCCGPDRDEEMSVEAGLEFWSQLAGASPHPCRIHLTGGEPFGDWERLIELARRASTEGLTPLQKVETNGFWATSEEIVRDRVKALDEAGMGKLTVSVDPYHQQYVPLERCRLLVRLAEELLGRDRVQVRWEDWAREGFDTRDMSDDARHDLFARYAARGRDRMNGRAAAVLGEYLLAKPIEEFADKPCREALLRSRHVHVDPLGRVTPGTCAGIILGTIGQMSVEEIWTKLDADYTGRGVLGPLVESGPAGLLSEALEAGYAPNDGYASKCHLCWDIRRHFALKGLHGEELCPLWMYGIVQGV